ncbi:MAG: TolC family protein [Candidatus Aminicenantes bacterium]|nr:TolC family protein [Candidatus Aminicenantes bacterium]
MRKISYLLFLILVVVGLTLASKELTVSGVDGFKNVLDHYIELGLKNNLVLKQEEFSLKKSLLALKEARGMFLPKISIEARYSLAGGGRIIEFPVGELMNPVYESLNQLLGIHNQPAQFPTDIEDEIIPFLRPREHETKIRLVQPIFQPRIYYNIKIKSNLRKIQQARIDTFKRQLISDIKTAYFTYLKTLKIKELLNTTRELLEENLNVSLSLYRNHKATEEIVFRSKAELSRIDQKIAEAEKNIKLSAAYFNFLINQPLDNEISVVPEGKILFKDKLNPKELEDHAINHRTEFLQIQGAIDAASNHIRLQGSLFLPSVSAVLDYGFQGESYRFTGEDDFWMASMVLSWNIFNGFQDSAKKIQAKIERKKLQTQLFELQQKIRMQVREAYHNLVVAQKTIQSTNDGLNSRKEAFHIISKKYEQGMVPQIEYIQARDNYTHAGINNIIAVFDYHIKEAQLERASAYHKL